VNTVRRLEDTRRHKIEEEACLKVIQIGVRVMLKVKEMFGARWEVFVEVACAGGLSCLPQLYMFPPKA
jgi:hypothetical protein